MNKFCNTSLAARELCTSCSTLLGPLRPTKCVVVESPSSSSRGDVVWTSDVLIFLRALSIHHPAAILVRDTVASTRKTVGSGSRTTVSWMCRLIAMSQQWKQQGVQCKHLSAQMYRATNVCIAAFKLVSMRPPNNILSSNDPALLRQLAAQLQHSDPTLEAWDERAAHNVPEKKDNEHLCMPMRIAVQTIRHLLSSTKDGHRLDFSLVRVNTVSGVSSSHSCADLGTSMEVLVRDAQRYATIFGTSATVKIKGIALIDGDCTYQDSNDNSICEKVGISTKCIITDAQQLIREYSHGGSELRH